MAVDVDWWARGIAIGGAAVAATSLGWNVFSWRRQGPVVKVSVTCTGRGDDMKLSGSIRNQGRFDAHIERAAFGWYSSPRSSVPNAQGVALRCDVPAEFIKGVTLPLPLPLPAEAGKEFTIVNIPKIDPGLSAALHDCRGVGLIFYTASGKRARAQVKYA